MFRVWSWSLIINSLIFIGIFQHPGGGELIADVAGQDATKAFDDFGHSSDAKQILKKFKIGELVEVKSIHSFIIFKWL